MLRKMLLVASAVLLVGAVGCRHRCCHLNEARNRPRPFLPDAPRNSILLPPANVPTTPAPAVPGPGSSNFPPPVLEPPVNPPPAPKSGGPDVLFPDPLPGSSSARPTQPDVKGILGAPVKPQTAEPPKAGTPGLAGTIKVKDGLFAGAKPTLDGFDALKSAGFRAVVYLHPTGQDVSAIKDMAATRGLTFHAIETTPETLAPALTEFNRVAADRLNRPAYVFGEDATRAGAVWYLHLRTVDSLNDDLARLRAKPLGLSDQGDEGRAFALAIQRVLESK